jgi:hypothetical protein
VPLSLPRGILLGFQSLVRFAATKEGFNVAMTAINRKNFGKFMGKKRFNSQS